MPAYPLPDVFPRALPSPQEKLPVYWGCSSSDCLDEGEDYIYLYMASEVASLKHSSRAFPELNDIPWTMTISKRTTCMTAAC